MSYSKEQQGQTVVFKTEPDGQIPYPFSLLALGFFPSLIFLIVHPAGFILSMLFFALVGWLMKSSKKSKKYRYPSTFIVTPKYIEINDNMINSNDIHRIVIRNHVINSRDEAAIIYHPDSMANAGNIAGQVYDRKRAEISYRVEVEAGGHATYLAGGLNETTAFAILSDVSKVLGLDVRQSN